MDRNPVTKIFKALRWLIEEPSTSTGVRELASALELTPSGAHRLLSQLVEEGMVRQDASGRYALGVEFFRLANIAAAKAPIRQAALVHMRHLVDACNETALLGIYDQGRQDMIFVATVESSHELRYVTPLNVWIPVHVGASGLAIMAFLKQHEIQSIIERTWQASNTETYRLETELRKIRERGWASSRGQRTAGAAGIAAPIFDASGNVVGGVAIKIPEQRLDEEGEDALVEHLLRCTRNITKEISGRPTIDWVAAVRPSTKKDHLEREVQ
jgi:DNA-binding IclR family transcriptional regulator